MLEEVEACRVVHLERGGQMEAPRGGSQPGAPETKVRGPDEGEGNAGIDVATDGGGMGGSTFRRGRRRDVGGRLWPHGREGHRQKPQMEQSHGGRGGRGGHACVSFLSHGCGGQRKQLGCGRCHSRDSKWSNPLHSP